MFMKRLVLFFAMMLMLSSCSVVYRSNGDVAKVNFPAVETATFATIEVSPCKIQYHYIPDKKTAKSLSMKQLLQNAIFNALQENGNADALVQVNYSVATKRGFFKRVVKSITVSGYPATYVDFREPTEEDLNRIETLSRVRENEDSGSNGLKLF